MPTYSKETRALLDVLSRRTIAYHPDLALALGSVPAAVILSQLLYWHGKQADPDGWIRKTAAELEEETGVTERQQEVTRPAMVEAGLVEFQRRGVPAMPFYRVNHDRIVELYLSRAGETSFPQTGKQESPVKGNLIPPNGDTNTEITSETTTESTGGSAPAVVSVKGFGKVYTAHPDARVAAYLDIMGQPHITASNAQIILDRVSLEFVEVWKSVLVLWASSAWNPRNIAGMIERYEGDKNAKRFPKAASSQKIGDWTPAKGMYPQVPDKPQPAPAPRKAQRVETPDVVTIVNGVEVPF